MEHNGQKRQKKLSTVSGLMVCEILKKIIKENNVSACDVKVKASHICVCVIDDCRDSDVPLLELSLSQLALEQEVDGGGTARCILASDYYNRVLSGWEPVIEPWR